MKAEDESRGNEASLKARKKKVEVSFALKKILGSYVNKSGFHTHRKQERKFGKMRQGRSSNTGN